MSEETKKQPETEQEQAAAETKAPAAESDKQEAEPAAEKTEKKDWFGKKSKELEAVKAKLEAAELSVRQERHPQPCQGRL